MPIFIEESTQSFRVLSWNINSILARLDLLKRVLTEQCPDFVLLQELKCQDAAFPYKEIEALGFKAFVRGEKAYNGVAILARDRFKVQPIDGTFSPNLDAAARYVEISVEDDTENGPRNFSLASVYVPNGGVPGTEKFDYKLHFLRELGEYLGDATVLDRGFIIGGDFNVAPYDIDVPRPLEYRGGNGFTKTEKQNFRLLLECGFYDTFRLVNPDVQEYSWWDYRAGSYEKNQGMRIDQILASGSLIDRLSQASHQRQYRNAMGSKPSDHIPIMADFSL